MGRSAPRTSDFSHRTWSYSSASVLRVFESTLCETTSLILVCDGLSPSSPRQMPEAATATSGRPSGPRPPSSGRAPTARGYEDLECQLRGYEVTEETESPERGLYVQASLPCR